LISLGVLHLVAMVKLTVMKLLVAMAMITATMTMHTTLTQ
jgi:hypothetical protein